MFIPFSLHIASTSDKAFFVASWQESQLSQTHYSFVSSMKLSLQIEVVFVHLLLSLNLVYFVLSVNGIVSNRTSSSRVVEFTPVGSRRNNVWAAWIFKHAWWNLSKWGSENRNSRLATALVTSAGFEIPFTASWSVRTVNSIISKYGLNRWATNILGKCSLCIESQFCSASFRACDQ